jgi:hypothetical protein
MKRRKFLIIVGAGVGSVAVPASLYFLSPTIKEYAVLLIQRELNYLKIEESSIEKYVDDYFEHAKNDLVSKLKWKAMYYLRISPEKSTVLYELVKYFLLSSSFFINRTDQTKVVEYLGLYSPYKSPVPNPFSFVLYPPDVIGDP